MARQLRDNGWADARALVGGWHAWLAAGMPVEPKVMTAVEDSG